jgi:VWFA-related protein
MTVNGSRARATAGRAAAITLLATVASGQTGPSPAEANSQTPAEPQAAFSDEVSVAWILVPVTVKSRLGWVRSLDREDFRLKVDGRTVRFPDFEPRAEIPWSLVFLQDLSGSMANGGRIEASRRAVQQFLLGARPGDEFAVASFAGTSTLVEVPFTRDLVPVRDAIGRWKPYGKTALHDAVAAVPQISVESRNIKRAAILITDGVDNASRISPAQARGIVRRADLPVYVLGLESGDPYAVSAAGRKIYRYADVLNLLAAKTGGRYFAIDDPDDLEEACAEIAEELRYQYVLGFETSGRGDVRFRRIEVEVRKRALEVVTRQGYRGKPPARR